MAVSENIGGGYPLKWFQNQDIARKLYECVLCLDVVKDAMQVRDCGHLFCRFCIEKVLKLQHMCPTCRKEISAEMIFPDKNANRAIGKLDVNCPSNECEWDGTLNSLLQEHNARCPFLVLNCNNVGCDVQVTRQDLEVHLPKCEYRTVVCEHCKHEHVFKDKDKHLSTCPFLLLECLNKCSEKKIPRNQMKEHLDTVCSQTVIKCKYSEFSCEYQCKRQEMEEHVNQAMGKHLELSTLEISRLKGKHEKDTDKLEEGMKKLKEEIEELKGQITDKVTPTAPPIMIITDFNKKLSEAKRNNQVGEIDGEPFYTSPHGYKLKMMVYLNEESREYKGYMAVFICVMKSDHDAILSWPFKKKYTFTLIDQQDNDEERKDIVRTMTPTGQEYFERPKDKENDGYGFLNFVSHEILLTRKYIEHDTVFITLSIEQ